MPVASVHMTSFRRQQRYGAMMARRKSELLRRGWCPAVGVGADKLDHGEIPSARVGEEVRGRAGKVDAKCGCASPKVSAGQDKSED